MLDNRSCLVKKWLRSLHMWAAIATRAARPRVTWLARQQLHKAMRSSVELQRSLWTFEDCNLLLWLRVLQSTIAK